MWTVSNGILKSAAKRPLRRFAVNSRIQHLSRNSLKDPACLSEIIYVSFFCAPGDFIEPTNSSRFEARLRRIIGRVNDFDFHLDRVPAALNPPLTFFAPLVHFCLNPPHSGQRCVGMSGDDVPALADGRSYSIKERSHSETLLKGGTPIPSPTPHALVLTHKSPRNAP